jgi:hypothetical protein
MERIRGDVIVTQIIAERLTQRVQQLDDDQAKKFWLSLSLCCRKHDLRKNGASGT